MRHWVQIICLVLLIGIQHESSGGTNFNESGVSYYLNLGFLEQAHWPNAPYSTTEAQSVIPAPNAGVIRNLACWLGTAPGAGYSTTWTVRVNGSNAPVAVTIAGTGRSATDTAHTVSVQTGDQLSLMRTPVGGLAAASSAGGCYFEVQ